MHIEELLLAVVIFAGLYLIIKGFTDFLLKRKLINAGHVDKVGILESHNSTGQNTYPMLKWGLVTLFAGIGLLILAFINMNEMEYTRRSLLQVGIELIAVSIGFLSYFILMRVLKK